MKYDPSEQAKSDHGNGGAQGEHFFFCDAQGDQHLALCLHCTDPATCGACSNGSGRFRIEASNRKEHRYEPGLLPLSCV